MKPLDLDEVRADWRDASTHVMPHWNCCAGHRVAHRVPALIAEVERLRAEVERFRPVADPSGDVLYIHNHETRGYRCGHVEWWNEAVLGPINDQGCDACESAPDGSWRPLYLRSGGA